MEFAITGYQMVVGIGAIAISLSIAIVVLKKYFHQKHKRIDDGHWSSRTKYKAYDVYRYTDVFFRSGMICSMLLALLAFNYTQQNKIHVSRT